MEYSILRLVVQPIQIKPAKTKRNELFWSASLLRDSSNATPSQFENRFLDPEIFELLAHDGAESALHLASVRLRNWGRPIIGHHNRLQSGKPVGLASTVDPKRLLAAMLFPLSTSDLSRLANAVLYPPQSEEQ
jgi:hypothetical protein